MAATYSKPALTFDQQLELIRSRGMAVEDEAEARRVLATVGYYRLSAYMYPFRAPGLPERFIGGASFARVVQLYEFDHRLRRVLLDAIDRIEVALRALITYHFAHEHGAFGHCSPNSFEHPDKHAEWIARLDKSVMDSKELFIEHYSNTYDGHPRVPLWMATEVMSFGSLTFLFKNAKSATRRKIARDFGYDASVLASWLLCLSYVRNLCAHHCRVWNREMALAPLIPDRDARWKSPIMRRSGRADRAFTVLLMLREASRRLNVDGGWADSVRTALAEDLGNPKDTFIAWGMGIKGNWLDHPVWSGGPSGTFGAAPPVAAAAPAPPAATSAGGGGAAPRGPTGATP